MGSVLDNFTVFDLNKQLPNSGSFIVDPINSLRRLLYRPVGNVPASNRRSAGMRLSYAERLDTGTEPQLIVSVHFPR